MPVCSSSREASGHPGAPAGGRPAQLQSRAVCSVRLGRGAPCVLGTEGVGMRSVDGGKRLISGPKTAPRPPTLLQKHTSNRPRQASGQPPGPRLALSWSAQEGRGPSSREGRPLGGGLRV